PPAGAALPVAVAGAAPASGATVAPGAAPPEAGIDARSLFHVAPTLPPNSAAFSFSSTSSPTALIALIVSPSNTISTVLLTVGALSPRQTARTNGYCLPSATMVPLPSAPLYWIIFPRMTDSSCVVVDAG